MTVNMSRSTHQEFRKNVHPNCIVCGCENERGLKMDFVFDDDQRCVLSEFTMDESLAGYRQVLHGGIICSIFDGAMVNWLFANGLTCVTAELKVRFRHSVFVSRPAIVKAWQQRSSHPLYLIRANIIQDGQVKATAKGKFMHKADLLESAVFSKR